MVTNSDIDYKAVLADLEARRAALDTAIAAIKQIIGQPDTGNSLSGAPVTGSSSLPTDTFFGMGVVDAARKYLTMVKRKQTAREIASALERGGLTHSSKDFYQTVYALLRRRANDEGDIVKLPDGAWGLAEWYPGMKSKRSKATKTGENGEEEEVDPKPDASATES